MWVDPARLMAGLLLQPSASLGKLIQRRIDRLGRLLPIHGKQACVWYLDAAARVYKLDTGGSARTLEPETDEEAARAAVRAGCEKHPELRGLLGLEERLTLRVPTRAEAGDTLLADFIDRTRTVRRDGYLGGLTPQVEDLDLSLSLRSGGGFSLELSVIDAYSSMVLGRCGARGEWSLLELGLDEFVIRLIRPEVSVGEPSSPSLIPYAFRFCMGHDLCVRGEEFELLAR